MPVFIGRSRNAAVLETGINSVFLLQVIQLSEQERYRSTFSGVSEVRSPEKESGAPISQLQTCLSCISGVRLPLKLVVTAPNTSIRSRGSPRCRYQSSRARNAPWVNFCFRLSTLYFHSGETSLLRLPAPQYSFGAE
jgi:hypothetical protein